MPLNITAGSDGNLWFTEYTSYTNSVGRITPEGVITRFPMPLPLPQSGLPTGIGPGPEGNIWFGEELANKIGRLRARNETREYVLALASGFTPTVRVARQGTPVQWSFYGPVAQTATDSSGMGLFDSGSKLPVSFYPFTFIAAGTYPYEDTQTPEHTGRITVPIKVNPTSGPPTTVFKVWWSSATAPAGFAFDVQISRPGGPGFVDWQVGVTTTNSDFTPDAGAGTYRFRARMRNMLNGKASRYSPARTIIVTP